MAKTMLRDSRTAANVFRLNSEIWDGTPKPGFLYYVRFVRSDSSSRPTGSLNGGNNVAGGGTNPSSSDWARGIGVLAKEIERPGVNFELDTINQYNKKRVIQKRVDYDPVSFTFWDTVDNRALNMFQDYFTYYYGDSRNNSATAWTWDIMADEMMEGMDGWGFIPPVHPAYHSFFSHIEFYYIYGGKYSRFDIVNPRIKSFKPSPMSYDESNGMTIDMSFVHEGLIYVGSNLNISDQYGLLQEMGLARAGFYDPRTNSGSAAPGMGSPPYAYTPGMPAVGGASLNDTSNATSASAGSDISKSSSTINTLFNTASVVAGVLSNTAGQVQQALSGLPIIGDNIPKRMAEAQKDKPDIDRQNRRNE